MISWNRSWARSMLAGMFVLASVASADPRPNGPAPGLPVDHESFQLIAERVAALYAPEVGRMGGELRLELDWEASEDVAYASHEHPPVFQIHLNGGATKNVDQDGFAYAVCHEVGHVLGGSPKYLDGFWASAEGQADYFAANVCLKKVFGEDDNIAWIRVLDVPASVREKCDAAYPAAELSALCQRIAMAGLSFFDDYRRLKGEEKKLSLDAHEKSKAKTLNRSYSSPQCRLDTALAGALCARGLTESPVGADGSIRDLSCTGASSARPVCWFRR